MFLYRAGLLMVCLSVLPVSVKAELNKADIHFSGEVVYPPQCTLSATGVLDVTFDSIDVNSVDGQQNKQAIPVVLSCTGTDSGNLFDLSLSVTGSTVSFGDTDDNATLMTPENANLGIRLLMDDKPLPVNQTATGVTADSLKTLQAVLVRRSGDVLEGGDFTGQATLRATYQ